MADVDFLRKRVLVVDDNKVNLKVISSLLNQLSVEAECVTGGEQAVEILKEKEFDLVIMDIIMPGMNGMEATAAIRALDIDYCKKLPIIACTVNTIEGDEKQFLDAGMDDLLPKPIQLDVLQGILDKFLPW